MITFKGFRIGVLFRFAAAWVGWHWSAYERRLCVNPMPFITVWIATPKGRPPKLVKNEPRLTKPGT